MCRIGWSPGAILDDTRSRSRLSMLLSRWSSWSIFLSLQVVSYERTSPTAKDADGRGLTHYLEEMRMRWRCSLGRCPAPVEVQDRFEMRQLAHGDSLSHRIYPWALGQFYRASWYKHA